MLNWNWEMAHRTSTNSLAPLATKPMGGFKAFLVIVEITLMWANGMRLNVAIHLDT